jgi:hypothetical protein
MMPLREKEHPMGLDDVCGDFMDMYNDWKSPSWRKRVERLRDDISGYAYDYVPGTRRVVIALCDYLIEVDDHYNECDRIAYMRLVRLAETISVSGCYPPGSPLADEADRWLKIVVADCDPDSVISDEVTP